MSLRPRPPSIFAERYPVAVAAGIIDFGLLLGAAWLCYAWRFDQWSMQEWYALSSLLWALTTLLGQVAMNVYGSWRGRGLYSALKNVFIAWVSSLFVVFLIAIGTQFAHYLSRQWMLSTVLVGFGAVLLFRLIIYALLNYARKQGRNQKFVLVISDTDHSHPVFDLAPKLPHYGYSIEQVVCTTNNHHFENELKQIAQQGAHHEIWICLSLKEADKVQTILHLCRHQMADIRFFPDLSDFALLNHKITPIAGLYSIDISCSPLDGSKRFLKRAEDLVLGTLIGLLILPMCIAIYLAIKISSPGPALFKQQRTGINGRVFRVYKFRSMEIHNEADGHVTQATSNDPRVTRLGAFLRRTSLDELPQFYNVLQGRMSIVGPRPHALAHNEHYKELIESYMRRHKVKPGITGWAQINGLRGETDTIDKMQKRVEYDLWYINNWSLGLDLKIIFLTVFKGFFNKQP